MLDMHGVLLIHDLCCTRLKRLLVSMGSIIYLEIVNIIVNPFNYESNSFTLQTILSRFAIVYTQNHTKIATIDILHTIMFPVHIKSQIYQTEVVVKIMGFTFTCFIWVVKVIREFQHYGHSSYRNVNVTLRTLCTQNLRGHGQCRRNIIEIAFR